MNESEGRIEIIERLAVIETLLKQALAKDDDHETRIRSLEKSKWWLAGGAAAIAALLSKTIPDLPI